MNTQSFAARILTACMAERDVLGIHPGKPLPPDDRDRVINRMVELFLEEGKTKWEAQKKERKKKAILPEAEQIYELYPKKVGRDDALRAITKALGTNAFSYLADKTNQFKEAVENWPSSYRYFQDGGDRCPHPASWFNAGRFADSPAEWKRRGAHTPSPTNKVSPKEPDGWRELFPDFVDLDKPWHLLQPAQQAYIIREMLASSLTSEAKHDTNVIKFRSA